MSRRVDRFMEKLRALLARLAELFAWWKARP